MLLFLLVLSLAPSGGVFTIWSLFNSPAESLSPRTEDNERDGARPVEVTTSGDTEDHQADNMRQHFDFNKERTSQRRRETSPVETDDFPHFPSTTKKHENLKTRTRARTRNTQSLQVGAKDETLAGWNFDFKRRNNYKPQTSTSNQRMEHSSGTTRVNTGRKGFVSATEGDNTQDYDDIIEHLNSEFDFNKETTADDAKENVHSKLKSREGTQFLQQNTENVEKNLKPKNKFNKLNKKSASIAGRQRLNVNENAKRRAEGDGKKRRNNPTVKDLKLQIPGGHRRKDKVGGRNGLRTTGKYQDQQRSEKSPGPVSRSDDWGTPEEYEHLLSLVENLNDRFSRFQKIITISDQEIDSDEKLTTSSEKMYVTAESAKRKQPTEILTQLVRPALGNFPAKRREMKPQKNTLMDTTKEESRQFFSQHPKPRFPHFPTTSGRSQKKEILRSRIGDLPSSAYDYESNEGFHLYF